MNGKVNHHKQRCETCGKRFTKACPVSKTSERAGRTLPQLGKEGNAWDITALVGCASHSSVSVENTPSYEDLARFAQWSQQFQTDALRMMRENGVVLDNLNDPMQKLAFTFYTNLCEIEQKSRQMFEDAEQRKKKGSP